MADRARVTFPTARIMASGKIRVFAEGTFTVPTTGQPYTEFDPGEWEVETIPDPEPRWEPEQVVVDASGAKFVRTEAGRWRHILGLDLEPNRPLTPLVPKP